MTHKKVLCKCGNDSWKIADTLDCSSCKHNGAYSEKSEGYIYDQKTIDDELLDRTETEEDNQCELGSCFNYGCSMRTCTKCANDDILPMMESY